RDFHVTGVQTCALPILIAGDPVNLRSVVLEAMELVRGQAATKHARLELGGKVRPLRVNGDPAQLREVVTELLINALDAARDPARSEERRVGKEGRCWWA